MTQHLPLVVLGVLAFAGLASASEVFVVTATFTDQDFALSEFATRLQVCKGNDFGTKSDAFKADCVHHLISTSAMCQNVIGQNGNPDMFVCEINGVAIDTAAMEFSCGDGDLLTDCPHEISETKAIMDSVMNCERNSDGDVITSAVPGFANNTCYSSAYCLQESQPELTSFGDFCPSAAGDYCCGSNTARLNEFPSDDFSQSPTSGIVDTFRGIDHIANMDIDVTYDVVAPAQLQVKVVVPYITAESVLNYTETDGSKVSRAMCPTTYLIDFLPPVSTFPGRVDNTDLPTDRQTVATWEPLSHFPKLDELGRLRSSCGNYDMTYANEADFVTKFKFPQVGDQPGDTFTYGPTPDADASVWNTTNGVIGIPNGNVGFWNVDAPVGIVGEQRITYTAGSSTSGHFDLVKAWSRCRNMDPNVDELLVKKAVDTETTTINGVTYDIDTYEWTLSVCSVGYFGDNCRTRTDTQLYAKTCRTFPAAFSVTPEQIAHVTVSPVTEQLIAKTFLQDVQAFQGDCNFLFERVALTLNLVMFGTNYDIVDSDVHDLNSPSGVLEGAPDNFNVSKVTDASFVELVAAKALLGETLGEGVYALKKRVVTSSGGVVVDARLIVVVSKCINTGNVNGQRNAPDAFAKLIADGSTENALIDLELVVEKSNVQVGSDVVPLPGDTKIRNTINLRILATKDTFVLPTVTELINGGGVTAYQTLYGSYASAKSDDTAGSPLGLADTSVLTGGDQLCSKHQLTAYDAQVANLLPNAIGSCMLKDPLPVWMQDLAGTTIYYKNSGMRDPALYTYGCFSDWIDVRTATVSTLNGLDFYIFTGIIPRAEENTIHDSRFWFVQKQKLEQTSTLGGELISDRFGSALFYYNTTGTENGGSYVSEFGDQFQRDTATTFLDNPAGCVHVAGALKSSCNLACFDVVDGLLTDPSGELQRRLLVHHVSVAVLANQRDAIPTNTFETKVVAPGRRMLLESVTTGDGLISAQSNGNSESLPSGARGITTMPSVREVPVDSPEDDPVVVLPIAREIDGGKFFAPVFFPIFFILIFIVMGLIGCFCINKRYKLNGMKFATTTTSNSQPPNPSKMFNKYSHDGNKESLLGAGGRKMFA